jgi:hypothetical protein
MGYDYQYIKESWLDRTYSALGYDRLYTFYVDSEEVHCKADLCELPFFQQHILNFDIITVSYLATFWV